MSKFTLLIFFMITCIHVLAHAQSTDTNSTDAKTSRLEKDLLAREKLLQLNFSSEGRGIHVSPGLIRFAQRNAQATEERQRIKKKLPLRTRRYGLTLENGEMVGVFKKTYRGMQIGVLGCVACHSGRAAGMFIVGIGNKNIDVGQLGADAMLIEKTVKLSTSFIPKSTEYKDVENSAIKFVQDLATPANTNLTQGLVPSSIIRKWFYDQAGLPLPVNFPRAAIKVPSFFGYGEKRKIGQFCDGGGNGNLPGWGYAVELAANQPVEQARKSAAQLQEVEESLGDLLPPKYPFEIKISRAERGRAHFEQTCAHCHGTYENDSQGLPIFKAPKLIPWEVVRTDHDRLEQLDEFRKLVLANPLSDLIQNTDNKEKYFAPRLHGVWARFPYLHNASVPNIRELLTPPALRTKTFSLKEAGERSRFDELSLGLTTEQVPLQRKKYRTHRDVYDTSLVGQSNQGHDFYTSMAEDQKSEIIEYLKTL